jgi:glucans biosynthesis protein C
VVFAAGASWFVKDPRPSTGFTVFLLWGSLWGMPLLFLVSGMGARYAMRTRRSSAFAAEQLARLGVPFAVGLAVLVPQCSTSKARPARVPPAVLAVLAQLRERPRDRTRAVAARVLDIRRVTFGPAHLWFLYVLLVFSITLQPLFAWCALRRGGRSLASWPVSPAATAAPWCGQRRSP